MVQIKQKRVNGDGNPHPRSFLGRIHERNLAEARYISALAKFEGQKGKHKFIVTRAISLSFFLSFLGGKYPTSSLD